MKTQHILTDGELRDIRVNCTEALASAFSLERAILNASAAQSDADTAQLLVKTQQITNCIRSIQLATGGPVKL